MTSNEFTDWSTVPSDPEPEDLGYDPLQLEVTESTADGGHLIILPHDEDYLREEAFIIVDLDSVTDLGDVR